MTLYTSDTDTVQKRAAKTAFVYLLASLTCTLFGAVYELFSHEVYSYYMVYALVFPLAGGTLPFLTISLFYAEKYPDAIAQNLYHSGIATLTVGSILAGILNIYGTTNSLTRLYWIIGFLLVISGVVAYIAQSILTSGKT